MKLLGTLVLIMAVVAVLSASKIRRCEPFEIMTWQKAYSPAHVAVYDMLTYDQSRVQVEADCIKPLVEPGGLVLDIGCGKGHLVAEFPAGVGVDVSPGMVSAARKRYPTRHFVQGDALNQWLFQSETVQVATLVYYSIYCFRDKHRLFQNVMYWLRPGGYCLVHVCKEYKYAQGAYRTNLRYNQRWDDTALYETFTLKSKKHRFVHQVFFESYETVLALVKQVGFTVVAEYLYPTPGQHLLLFQKPGAFTQA
jgi:SAM-dependent methyltransferase